MTNSAFISYRRETSAFIARAVFQNLRAYRYDVFMDVESINSGQFETVILNQIKARPHFLLILTPGCLDRCGDTDDWLRREIEFALEQQRNIIPLTTMNFDFNSLNTIHAGRFAALTRFNAVNIPHDYFEEAMARLRLRFLQETAMSIGSTPTPSSDTQVVERILSLADNQRPVTEAQLSAQDYFERGIAYSGESDSGLSDKIAAYSKAIELNPTFAEAYFNRGLAYFATSKYELAIKDFTKTIELKPHEADAGILKAVIADIEGAISDCDAALKLSPNDAQAYLGRGIAKSLSAEFDSAIDDISQMLMLDKDLSDVLDKVLLRMKPIKEGVEMGDRWTGVAYLVRAMSRGFRNADAAIDDLQQAVEIQPLMGQILAQARVVRDQKRKTVR
jgi:tetratricopeptide (TPR) repeat protein